MIPFQGKAPAKHFVANKPNPIGLKKFVLCGNSGRALDFELYQAAGTGISEKYKNFSLCLVHQFYFGYLRHYQNR